MKKKLLAWFYVIDGRLANDYTGYVNYDGSKFFVSNGMLATAACTQHVFLPATCTSLSICANCGEIDN